MHMQSYPLVYTHSTTTTALYMYQSSLKWHHMFTFQAKECKHAHGQMHCKQELLQLACNGEGQLA